MLEFQLLHIFPSLCVCSQSLSHVQLFVAPWPIACSEVKASAWNAGDLGLIPGLGRSPGEGHGNPLQYSCLENPMDGGAWWAAVDGVEKSWTRLRDFTFHLISVHVGILISKQRGLRKLLTLQCYENRNWTLNQGAWFQCNFPRHELLSSVIAHQESSLCQSPS